MTTALYLAHLNPLTRAHVDIITELRAQADSVKVMPVVFRRDSAEINSRSFPFTFEHRRQMVESVFGDGVSVTDDYTFFAPFRRYMPPLLSPKSWRLRRRILGGVDGDYFTYTGDRAEGYMLAIYMLRPKVGARKQISATSVKERMYRAASGEESGWEEDVPEGVAGIIRKNWNVVREFARAEDRTARVFGMKFPKDGY